MGCVKLQLPSLTHWGRVTYICVSKLTIIGSDNGLSPGRSQAIIWTNDGLLLIGPLGTNFSEILIEILTFSFKKMHLKVSSAKWRLFGLGLNVLRRDDQHHNEGNLMEILNIFCHIDTKLLNHCDHVQHHAWTSENEDVVGAAPTADAPTTGLILGLRPANERCCYFVTTSLNGWAHT